VKPALPIVALGLALAACAAPAPGEPNPASASKAGPRQCFFASNVNNFAEVDDRAVNVRVGASQIWRLDFQGQCPDIQWSSSAIGLRQRGGGGAICDGFDVDVITTGGSGIPTCPVRSVRRLSQAEIAALPSAQKP
jgi:hypothetical protein